MAGQSPCSAHVCCRHCSRHGELLITSTPCIAPVGTLSTAPPSPSGSLSHSLCAQVMQELAEQINARPLPPVSQRAGLMIPPDEDALLAQNLRLQVQPARLSEGDVTITAPQGEPLPYRCAVGLAEVAFAGLPGCLRAVCPSCPPGSGSLQPICHAGCLRLLHLVAPDLLDLMSP